MIIINKNKIVENTYPKYLIISFFEWKDKEINELIIAKGSVNKKIILNLFKSNCDKKLIDLIIKT